MQIFLWLIGICALFALIGRIATAITSARLKSSSRQYYAPVSESRRVVKQVEIQNCLTYKSGGREYKARFENGIVYAISDYMKEYIIGYYVLEQGTWKVRCASDKGEIATIDKSGISSVISFNRLGDLKRHKKNLMRLVNSGIPKEELERQYNQSARSVTLVYRCAEVFGSIIEDVDTRETIASSTSSDCIGNAAAFTCLQYDVVMEGKYHEFYSAIN